VMEISDTVTVMRAGETVGRLATKDASPAAIARMMVGRDVVLAADRALPTSDLRPLTSDLVLQVKDLVVASSRRPNEVDRVSFDVNAGEIFGIAGVEGNGQTELIEAIAGLRPIASGRITLGGVDVTDRSVRERADGGLSHIPEDRHRRGLVLEYSVADNLILGQQHQFASRGVLQRARIDAHAAARIARYDIRPPGAELPAREMTRPFSLLLAAQPTRGVDVGAIEFIHAELLKAREEGKAVLLVSADLTEVLALSDRIAVLYEGRIVVTLPRGEASAERLGPYMTGATRGAA
jgi:general nucleoside transport system ATP-binding protein